MTYILKLNYGLGIELNIDKKILKQCISTNKMYIFDIYKRFNMGKNKVVNVPLEAGLK
jgi:hypothetical protein